VFILLHTDFNIETAWLSSVQQYDTSRSSMPQLCHSQNLSVSVSLILKRVWPTLYHITHRCITTISANADGPRDAASRPIDHIALHTV